MPPQKPSRSKQDYGTPQEFVDAAKGLLGIAEFDIDLAASADNAKAAFYFDSVADGLSQAWSRPEVAASGWNFLNPPFTKIEPWAQKCWYEWWRYRARTGLLVPASTGSRWWRDWVHRKARVFFLYGRLTFDGCPINPKTGKVDPYPKDCVFICYGLPEGYEIWDWKRGVFNGNEGQRVCEHGSTEAAGDCVQGRQSRARQGNGPRMDDR